MRERAWLITSWTGRSFLAAVLFKGLVLAALAATGGSATLEFLDRAVNLALIVLACVSIYQLTQLVRARMLWRVRRKLILSYILIGAVPFLLLVAFSLLGFLLVFFDISSYLVQNRLNNLTDQANTLARTTLIEVERTPFEGRPDVLSRRQSVLETRYPGILLSIVSTSGSPRCGLAPSKDLPPPKPPASLPRWVSCKGFAGLLLFQRADSNSLRLMARAAALPNRANPDYAVLVDLPVDEKSNAESLQLAGIQLGTLSPVSGDNGATPVQGLEGGNDANPGQPRSFFNTATFLSYTDWQHGLTGRAALAMNVRIGTLYAWLGGEQGRSADVTFSRILLFMLVGIGALLLVIEMVALGNGLALARSITSSVDELFVGTEHVKRGDFAHRIATRTDDQLGELASSFNEMTTSISGLLEERNEKRRLEEELRIARGIQMSLLPQGPLSVPGLSIAALCAPAREVGGDYYDFLPLGKGRVGMLIADVSGKGTSAALYMAELKGLMLSLSRIHASPRGLLIEADHIIASHLDNRSFITMIYAVIDTSARTLTCARAGHTPFIQIPAGDHARARVLAPGGMVLGLNLDNGERFEQLLVEVTIPLHKGDLFFFFTDGISEAMDGEGTCFGEGRLTAFLEAHAGQSPDAIRDRLLDEVEEFAGDQPQHDDITMVILKVDEEAQGSGLTAQGSGLTA
jgi:serine phosphatase RsbU (regulator of sigma subunit)